MKRKHRSPRSTVKHLNSTIDALEPRRMLAVYDGTTGSDAISIFVSGSNTHVVINGATLITAELDITINAGEGDDAISVASTRVNSDITVRGESGNDSLVNSSLLDLDGVYQGDFAFEGGAGVDTVVADNSNDSTTAANIFIRFNGVAKGLFSLDYSEIEDLDYRDSNGGNRIVFSNINPDPAELAHFSIQGNGGNDIIANTSAAQPDDGEWITSLGEEGASVDGGAGTDTLILNNSMSEGNSRFEMDATTIKLTYSPSIGPLTYAGCEAVEVVANHLADQVLLNGKPSGTSLRYDARDGNDTFTAGGDDWDANGFLLSNTTVLGGSGVDRITCLDAGDFAGNTYNWSSSSLGTTLGFGFNLSSIEMRTLEPASVFVFNGVNAINLNSFESSVTTTTINGGRPCIVNVAQGTLADLVGQLNVNLGGGSQDQLIINDQNSGGAANGYEVRGTFVRKNNTNQTINYEGVGKITLNTSGVLDAVNALGTGAGTALTLNTNGGDDLINIGSGNLDADFGGPVTVNGGTGLNDVNVGNASDESVETITLNGGTLIDGFTHTFSSVDDFRITLGTGGTNLTVNSAIPKTTVTGGAGVDTFTVGGGNIAAGFPSITPSLAPIFDGGGGSDAITFDDRNGSSIGSYEFQRPTGIDRMVLGSGGSYTISFSNMESATLEASDLPTSGTTTAGIFAFQSLTPLRINGNGGSDVVFVMDTAHPVMVNTGTGAHDQIDVNLSGGAPVTAIVEQDDEINGLMVRPGGTLRVASGATLAKSQVSGSSNYFDITGTLDLAGGALLSRAGGSAPSLAAFQTWLTRGYSNGAWNGTHGFGAINSSLAATGATSVDAVGYGLGSEIAITTIGGFNIAAGDVVLRYTFYGDADLNQSVDFDDYVRTDAGFNTNRTGWSNGEFDFNNTIDFDDYVLIDQGFNGQ